eukprot:NODE_191_length_13422_cov_1.451025.p5 type:complete len:286 gc:universal NODE_191_length_13422_cov_1.451025:7835-8692(+)
MNSVQCLRYFFMLLLAAAAILGIFVFPKHLPAVLEWIRTQQLLGSILFIITCAVSIWCVSPVSIFIIAAGFMYGIWWGSLIAYIGYVCGMLGAFLLGKTILRSSVQAWLYEKYPSYESIDQAISGQGFKILILFRLSPVLPCNVINYICSLTSISFPSYAFASIFGVIPTVIIYANIGAMVGSLSGLGFEHVEIPPRTKNMMILLSSVFTTLSLVLIGVISKKTLRQQLLPIVDERVDLSKDEEEGNVDVQPIAGYLYSEKITIISVITLSSIALIVGCTLILIN